MNSFAPNRRESQKPFGLESYSDAIEKGVEAEHIIDSHKSLSAWSPIRTEGEYGAYPLTPEQSQKPFGLESYSDDAAAGGSDAP